MSFERFKMRDGRVIVIDTMEGQIQLNAFRDFLSTGLQVQLEVISPPSSISEWHSESGFHYLMLASLPSTLQLYVALTAIAASWLP